MTWQTPKVDWTPADGVADADFNRIEGNIGELNTLGANHASATTAIHGVGASTVESAAGATAKVDTHAAAVIPHPHGRLSKSVGGTSDVTLTAAEALNNQIIFTGALTGNINVIFPVDPRFWLVRNSTTGAFTLTCKTPAGTGIVILAGEKVGIRSDGTNLVPMITGLSGNLNALNHKIIAPGIENYYETCVVANSSTAYTFNLANGNVFFITLTGDCTLTMPSLPGAGTGRAVSFTVRLVQDGTGGRTITFPSATVMWTNGVVPPFSTLANRINKVVFTGWPGAAKWEGELVGRDYV